MSATAVRALLGDLDEDGLAELAERLGPFLRDRPVDADALLTPVQVAEHLGVSVRTVNRMAADGRLPAVKVGRGWRFAAGKLHPGPPARPELGRETVLEPRPTDDRRRKVADAIKAG